MPSHAGELFQGKRLWRREKRGKGREARKGGSKLRFTIYLLGEGLQARSLIVLSDNFTSYKNSFIYSFIADNFLNAYYKSDTVQDVSNTDTVLNIHTIKSETEINEHSSRMWPGWCWCLFERQPLQFWGLRRGFWKNAT